LALNETRLFGSSSTYRILIFSFSIHSPVIVKCRQ
jgi:hypothetical protein